MTGVQVVGRGDKFVQDNSRDEWVKPDKHAENELENKPEGLDLILMVPLAFEGELCDLNLETGIW